MQLIESEGWDNLVFGKKSLYSGEYAVAVRKGRSALLAQFSEGFKILEENGEYRKISDRWLGLFAEKPVSLRDALAYSAMVIVPLSLVLLLVFLWSFFLQRQVAARTKALRDSEEFQRAMITCSPVAIYSIDLKGNVVAWSASAQRVFGWSEEEITGRPLPIVPGDKCGEFEALRDHTLSGEGFSNKHLVRQRKDGSLFDASLSAAPIRDGSGTIIGIMGAVEDITDRIRAEKEHDKLQAQLSQARKMESVGRLAGGVAHDYNNMLGVIMGYVEMAMERLLPDDPLQADLTEIMKATQRSIEITRQLLAFARKQTIAPRVIDLNETVEGMLKMLRRLIGEDIDLVWHPAREPGIVKMDPTQIDQILANLCVNARDAIGGVGKLTIETNRARLDEDYCVNNPGAVPGDYVMLIISDDGCGMDRDTLGNLFEPYFTTKGLGKGTGLGLATVYGIVKQNGGFIQVYSEPGNGTTFKIYLPVHHGQQSLEPEPEQIDLPRGNGEVVLIVEDEASILKLAQAIMTRLGYTVIAAPSPAQAITLAEAHDGDIQLMITDVVMPEMNGRDLADRLKDRYPTMHVLFMSGYTADVIANRGVLGTGTNFVQKPFSQRDLAVKVREALK
jgi:two-component system sensor histidine kinase EvgS